LFLYLLAQIYLVDEVAMAQGKPRS
jgi:hypothetical protein